MTMFSIPDIQSIYATTFDGTKTGTFGHDKSDKGTFELMVSHQNGATIYDRVTDYANGNSTERKTTITKNADGTYSEAIVFSSNGKIKDVSAVNIAADGSVLDKTSQRYEADGVTLGSKRVDAITTNADGSKTDNATVTSAKGAIETIAATFVKTANGMSDSEVITNAAGKTEDINYVRSIDDGKVTQTWSGVNFAGLSFSRSVTHALHDAQHTDKA